MNKIQLYIAVTIDGFIARENGSLDWLDEIPNSEQTDYGYNDFYKEVSTVVMGRKTYEEILGFDVEWPYSNCISYVFTKDKDYLAKTENTKILNEVSNEVIEMLRKESNRNIWNVGGGDLISDFLNLDAIDEMVLSIIPVVLGKGIRLFPNEPKETKFELKKAEPFETGVVNLTYLKK